MAVGVPSGNENAHLQKGHRSPSALTPALSRREREDGPVCSRWFSASRAFSDSFMPSLCDHDLSSLAAEFTGLGIPAIHARKVLRAFYESAGDPNLDVAT